MKLYRYVLPNPNGKEYVYWDGVSEHKAKYQGDTNAELRFRMEKGTAQGYVRAVDVPVDDAQALAKWLNAELG